MNNVFATLYTIYFYSTLFSKLDEYLSNSKVDWIKMNPVALNMIVALNRFENVNVSVFRLQLRNLAFLKNFFTFLYLPSTSKGRNKRLKQSDLGCTDDNLSILLLQKMALINQKVQIDMTTHKICSKHI